MLRLLLKKSQEGTRIVYIPGNHDDDLRALAGVRFGNIDVALRDVHVTATGRRLLVLHGDEFDARDQCGALALLLGSLAYVTLLVSEPVRALDPRALGPPVLVARAARQSRSSAKRSGTSRPSSAHRCARPREAGVDGVVCGHIHKADLIERDGLIYCNDGDWVESCTALVERRRRRARAARMATAASVAAAAAARAAKPRNAQPPRARDPVC